MPTMRLRAALALGMAVTPAIAASDSSRPRGVGPQFAKFYTSTSKFACISNPSITIPITAVNDDFCDCPDGSDEPGTAACSYLTFGSPELPASGTALNLTPALPGFYCKNKGHIPSYIPFTNVNDGICDYELCCDGSDEHEGVGGVNCNDKCKEIGKEWRKADERRQLSLGAANKKKKEMQSNAQRLRKEVEDRIATLEAQIQAEEIKVSFLEKELTDITRREKGRVIKGAQGGKLGVLVGLAKQRTEELVGALERVRIERDSARERVQELEALLSKFKEEYNPNFNDEGVKRAVRSWEDYAARDKGSDKDEGFETDLEAILSPDSENVIQWEDYEKADAESDTDVLYQFEKYLPPSLRSWVDEKLRAFRVLLIENGVLAEQSSPDGDEPKAVVEARARLTSAQNDLSNDKNDLEKHKEDLLKDYGPHDVFRAINGQCIDMTSGEYKYELCFMSRTSQISQKGGGSTGMGDFTGFEKMTVDEDLPADGRGLGSGERYVMLFENGQHCWNGPNRSTKVVLACAEKDEIWKVVEEEKCVYRMEVGTPAVCESASPRPATEDAAKDEL